MANVGVYATFYEVKEFLFGSEDQNDLQKDDRILQRFCVQASRAFDRYCHRRFYPIRETRCFDHPDRITELILDDDLLEVNTLTTDNGDTTVSASDYFLMTGDVYGRTPYSRIKMNADGDQFNFEYGETWQRANAVDGLWGYHEDWSNAWANLDTVQDNPLGAATTTLTVADADGEDENGLTPRFQEQQLIRFGTGVTAEMAFVTQVDNSANTLTIRRGVNGSTAAQQANGTAIYVYRPMDDIRSALLTLSAYYYRRRSSVGGADDRPLASATGVMIMPNRLPGEVKDALAAYKRVMFL